MDLRWLDLKPVVLAIRHPSCRLAGGLLGLGLSAVAWPNFPNGISPWKAADASWGSLYFPNTRELWQAVEEEPPPAADSTPQAGG